MDETNPPGGKSTSEDLAAEFRALGKNLKDLLRSAWQSPERARLQKEIENGLAEVTASLSQAFSEFEESPSGQRLKEEIQGLQTRLQSGELEKDLREQLLSILRKVNEEIAKTSPHTPPAEEQDNQG